MNTDRLLSPSPWAWGHRLRLWLADLGNYRTAETSGRIALVQAIVIGLLAGIASVLFRWGMGAVGTWRNWLGLHPDTAAEWLILPLIGLLGGALAGHLTVYLAPEAKGSGIPQIKHALADPSLPTRRRTIWVKFVGAVVGIGSGLSMGREGPTVQIGGGIGEWVHRWLPGTIQQRRSLIAAGAGAGVAAAFNAPIAGFIFTVEELLQDWSATTMATSVLATVTAAAVARLMAGNIYMYHLPATQFHLTLLPSYVVLGLVAGLMGMTFIRSVLLALRLFPRIPRLPAAWYPAVAGFLTGCVGLFVPEAIGGSHDLAEMAFHGHLVLGALVVAFVAKFALTVLAYGSGAPGGVFAPTLVLGALLGAGVGTVTDWLFSGGQATIAGFAFVGMGALFTAVARAPITAILIVVELTGNYEQILPLMLACGAAHLAAHALGGVSIYDALLAQSGIHLETADPGTRSRLTVDQVMTTEVESLDAALPLAAARQHWQMTSHTGLPVLSAGRLVGMLTESDVLAALAGGVADDVPIATVASQPLVTIHAADTVGDALSLMAIHRIGRLVVVDDGAAAPMVGIITRSDLLRALAPAPVVRADQPLSKPL